MKPISQRGRTFTGTVISNNMTKTVTVEWKRRRHIPKYERYEIRRTRVKAHDELDSQVGDIVRIVETRPLSKTKHFLVLEKITKEAAEEPEKKPVEKKVLEEKPIEPPKKPAVPKPVEKKAPAKKTVKKVEEK